MKRNWKLLTLKRICRDKKGYNYILLDYFQDKFLELKNKPRNKGQRIWKQFISLFK